MVVFCHRRSSGKLWNIGKGILEFFFLQNHASTFPFKRFGKININSWILVLLLFIIVYFINKNIPYSLFFLFKYTLPSSMGNQTGTTIRDGNNYSLLFFKKFWISWYHSFLNSILHKQTVEFLNIKRDVKIERVSHSDSGEKWKNSAIKTSDVVL